MATHRRPALLTAGVIGTTALALSMSGTLSAFSAAITNTVNTGGVGSLIMQESGKDGTGAAVTCTTSASSVSANCATINKYGGDLNMNTTSNNEKIQTITIKNLGTMDAGSFTLTAGDCTLTANGNTGNLCNEAIVTITQDGTQVFQGTPAALKAGGAINLATANAKAGGTSSFDITFSTAAASNAVQGQSLSQPLIWTYNA